MSNCELGSRECYNRRHDDDEHDLRVAGAHQARAVPRPRRPGQHLRHSQISLRRKFKTADPRLRRLAPPRNSRRARAASRQNSCPPQARSGQLAVSRSSLFHQQSSGFCAVTPPNAASLYGVRRLARLMRPERSRGDVALLRRGSTRQRGAAASAAPSSLLVSSSVRLRQTSIAPRSSAASSVALFLVFVTTIAMIFVACDLRQQMRAIRIIHSAALRASVASLKRIAWRVEKNSRKNEEGPRLGSEALKGRVPVIRPRRDRIMGSSILASLSEAGGNDPFHSVPGPLPPHVLNGADRVGTRPTPVPMQVRCLSLGRAASMPTLIHHALGGHASGPWL